MTAMLQWHLGTMGFSYKEWNAVFYPDGLQPRDYLSHYSQIFDTVELDSTFYGTPKQEYVERWDSVTPPEFIFCVKTPKEITHDRQLVDTTELMTAFLDRMTILGDKLGPILIQLPPDFSFTQIHQLAVFLRQLPGDFRFAVEFRHASWNTTATGQLLQNHNVCWVSTDYKHLPPRVFATADFLYIRWIGRHGRYQTKDVERIDPTPRLITWWQDVKSNLDGIESVYGFFNDDFAGHAPATCNRFKQLVGLPIKELKPPQQGRLF